MAYERTYQDVEQFVFDLDGTIWRWNELNPGVKKTLEELQDRGRDLYYLTNNSVLTREKTAEKLRKLGLDAERDHVLTASYMAAHALDSEGVRKAFVIGEDGLRQELGKRGIKHTEDADHVLVGLDRNFSYWKMATAADLIRDGATCWATARDPYWWAGDRVMPGTGAELAGIMRTADAHEVRLVGKPSTYARDAVKEAWKIHPHRTALIGDSLETDVRFGNKMGFLTGLVLGGVSKEDDLAHVSEFDKPHIVFREFSRILQKV